MNLGQIRNLTRGYLNEAFAAFWTDSQLNDWINVACRKYHIKIKNVSRNHFTTRVTFETVANQEYYSLPANCKDLRLVSIVNSDGKEDFLSKAYWPNPDAWAMQFVPADDAIPQQYWLVGPSMRLKPKPSAAMTIRLYYEARQVALASDADVPSFDEDYHDLAAKWAAVEASTKDEKKRDEIMALVAIRELDLLQDVFHRVNPPVAEVEGFLEGMT